MDRTLLFSLLSLLFTALFTLYLSDSAVRRQESVLPTLKCPWVEGEELVGQCPKGTLTKVPDVTNAEDCGLRCCQDAACVTWLYRGDTGCEHGPDVRIGMEKDGTPKWCEVDPPRPWQGQHLIESKKQDPATSALRVQACSAETWNPNALQGQCLGLGDQRKGAPSDDPASCRDACCADKSCDTWQWREDKGCFYGKRGFRCYEVERCICRSSPLPSILARPHNLCVSCSEFAFQPFTGRRKRIPGRNYLTRDGKPQS